MGMIKNNIRPFYQSTAEYWRIRSYTEIDKNKLNVILDCYLTKTHFLNGSNILETYQIDLDLNNIVINTSNLREFLYDYISSNYSFFSGVIRDIGD